MRYLLRKLGLLLITGWAALTINYVLPQLVPGDPIGVMLARYQGRLSPQAADALRAAFGLSDDRGWFLQYLDYWRRMLTGDFGLSLGFFPAPVSEILAQSVPWTLALVGVTTLLAFGLGTLLGTLSGWRRGTASGDTLVLVALFLSGVPYFWFALIVLYVFAFLLGWFPLGGGYGTAVSRADGFAWVLSVLYHAVLPAVTIIVTATGGWLLTMRNNLVSVLGEDYIAFARAKGLSGRRVMLRYAARNAVLPSFTAFAMALGFVVSGSLLTEIVFSYPGLGFSLYQAVVSLDYPLMQAIFLFITLAVLVANFLADVAYALLDPRVRSEGA
jgi:peptide/nickel transport system permease protein